MNTPELIKKQILSQLADLETLVTGGGADWALTVTLPMGFEVRAYIHCDAEHHPAEREPIEIPPYYHNHPARVELHGIDVMSVELYRRGDRIATLVCDEVEKAAYIEYASKDICDMVLDWGGLHGGEE